jgi:hypothetical protein
MAYFKRDRFGGIAPGVAPRLLAESFGQLAENVDVESGKLVALKNDINVDINTTLNNNAHSGQLNTSSKKSLYFYKDTFFLAFAAANVNVVPGPIPGDTTNRIYITGAFQNAQGTGDFPRVLSQTEVLEDSNGADPANTPPARPGFRLGIPAPGSAPTTTVSGSASTTQTPNDVSYVYTFVSSFGEEGPPSAPSTIIELTDTQTVVVDVPSFPTSGAFTDNRNFNAGAKKRLYRSNTGSTNTTFQFVAETDYTNTTITDNKDADELGEVLPSSDWIGPPDDDTSLYPDGPMINLIPLAQGVMAGFTGKRFCLSEPFLPHAWPISYRITLEEDIVAIASTANGVAALTNGQPYFITGTDPSAMVSVRIDFAQACVNRSSVVDMGDYVLYAGPDGLCAVQSASGSVVTKGLISVPQWNSDFFPTQIKAFYHEGTYVAFYQDGSTNAGWIYDPRSENATLTTFTTSSVVQGGYTIPKTGELHIIIGTRVKKFRGDTSSRTLKFKSKKFVTPTPLSMAWVSVHADSYPAVVKVFADGTLIADYSVVKNSAGDFTQVTTVPSGISNKIIREPIMRLPAKIGQEWEVQVEGSDINEFCLAQSMDEIRAL